MNDNAAGKYGACNTCTIRLVYTAYSRAPWFRLVREPLRYGMVVMGWWHGIDPKRYHVYTEGCRGCIRFTKEGLKERSALFRWLNGRINPMFDCILGGIVTAEEVVEAKQYAREATRCPPQQPVPEARNCPLQ